MYERKPTMDPSRALVGIYGKVNRFVTAGHTRYRRQTVGGMRWSGVSKEMTALPGVWRIWLEVEVGVAG